MARAKNPIIRYFRGAFQELSNVRWPSRAEAWQKAWIVVAFSLVFGIFLGGLDYLFNQLVQALI